MLGRVDASLNVVGLKHRPTGISCGTDVPALGSHGEDEGSRLPHYRFRQAKLTPNIAPSSWLDWLKQRLRLVRNTPF